MDTPHAVSERSSLRPDPQRDPIDIDTGQAHTSRIYDYLLGGNDNFAVDREAAEHAFSAYPGGLDAVRSDARANRAFLGRAVRFLAEAGIRQFLDIGTGIPGDGNVDSVLQRVAPEARVVYVDNDPIVLAHAHALLGGKDRLYTDFIDGDLLEPRAVLRQASDVIDFQDPVAILLLGLLHVVPDSVDPHGAVATYVQAAVPGSYLAISHMTTDFQPAAMTEVSDRLQESTGETNPPAFRSGDELARFFDGLDVVEPGMVQIDQWRPDPGTPARGPGDHVPMLYAGVGRKSP
jgi:S-adenosyl methyltransferase